MLALLLLSLLQPAPHIARLGGEARLFAPTAILAALSGRCADFVPWRERDYMPLLRKDYIVSWRQAPFAVIGDFNGDGRPDAALAGQTPREGLLIALLSQGTAYRCRVVDAGARVKPADLDGHWLPGDSRDDDGLGTSLSYVAPGLYRSGYEPAPLRLQTAAFAESFYAKAAGIYHFDGRQFRWYVTAD